MQNSSVKQRHHLPVGFLVINDSPGLGENWVEIVRYGESNKEERGGESMPPAYEPRRQ